MCHDLVTMLLLAHAGHWALGLIYFAPVLVVVGALAVMSRIERDDDPA